MSRARREDGFTLVELLVAMAIFLVVVSATLSALEVFQRQAKADNRRADAQDTARNAVDQISSTLRNAVGTGTSAALDKATASDIVFQAVDPSFGASGSNASRLMRVRYCVDASTTSNQRLVMQTQHWTTATAPALAAGATASCPAATTGAGGVWDANGNRTVTVNVVNTSGSGAAPVFSYNPSSASVSTVDVDLSTDTDVNNPPAATTLHTALSLRNLNQPPAAQVNCEALGSLQVSCDSDGTADPEGQPLLYAWSYGSGTTCTNLSVISGASTAQISKSGLTAGQAYCFGLTVTDPAGLTASSTTTVTAR